MSVGFQHKGLAAGRWQQFSLVEQMANIGAEVGRTIGWQKKGDAEYALAAFYRALELIDLTLADPKNRKRLKEVTRVREALCDHFVFDNEYQTTDKLWERYFFQFNYAARNMRAL